ncbi:MAG: helicase-exonuclease AddAB subunit AddA [Clostridiales bacterium]|nr:MAG: helicase-exonuclease AddAB subunit AddA [Clostridiales bacterium]
MAWTPEQQKAIYDRGHNLIISAAAGSGKTAVLTERVVKYILGGGDIERLLIVTFTNAAASEMRERIAGRLSDACRENPKDKHLRRQRVKLSRAQISTIDSYMANIVRRNFEKLGVSPRFGTMDETELSYIMETKLDEILENRYATSPQGFSELLRILGGDGENEALENAVLEVYKYIQSIPFCDTWLLDRLEYYDNPLIWTEFLCNYYKPLFAESVKVFESLCGSGELTDKERALVNTDCETAKKLYEACLKTDYTSLYCLCNEVDFGRMPSSKNNSPQKLYYKEYREVFKEMIRKSEIFKISPDEISYELSSLKVGIKELVNIVLDLEEAVSKEFLKQNKYSFSEIAKMAFSLLISKIDKNSENVEITPLASEIRESFDEILIDEYQDVNDLQDMFFYAISRDNLFVVGDVKQSIYAFRRANPMNFIRKKDQFEKIDLNKNFRSRGGVLGFTNFVCKVLFSNEFGGLTYDKNEALVQGSSLYEAEETPDVEMNIVISDTDQVRNQAQVVADKIKQLLREKYRITLKNGGSRCITPSDIAILLSVVKNGEGDIFRDVLLQNGIPVYMGSGSSFFQSVEVNTIINLLKTIINPYNDTALFITMSSPLYGFSDEEIAKIRLCITRKKRLFCAVSEYAKTDNKTREFVDDLNKLKILSANLPLSKLIWQIYTEKEYLSYVSSLELGDIRYENMLIFLDFVRRYETDLSGSSLSQFLSFIDFSVEKNKMPEQEAAPQGSYVTIMTVHKSKGLEFPVCILPRLDKELSKTGGVTPKIVLDDTLGIGTKIRNEAMTYEENTFMYELISLIKKRNDRSEALRRLYVALTRARQKLILIGSVKQSQCEKFSDLSLCTLDGSALKIYVNKQSSFLDLILTSLSHHPNCFSALDGLMEIFSADFKIEMNILNPTVNTDSFIVDKHEYKTLLSTDEIRRRFDFEYTPSLSHIPAKVSVTELSKGFLPDEDSVPLFKPSKKYIPQFISEKNGLNSAEKGSIVHRFLSLADLSNCIQDEKTLLVNKGIFTVEEVKVVDDQAIEYFANSDLYKTVLNSNKILKEHEFIVGIDASEYDKSVKTDKKILLQGAIDLLCEYDDGFIIIDYKTDNKSEEELLNLYSKQLYYYKYAVEKLYGKKVKNIYIWSLKLSKKIEVVF